jgi:hypothetical protein
MNFSVDNEEQSEGLLYLYEELLSNHPNLTDIQAFYIYSAYVYFIMEAISKWKIVGYQGKVIGSPIYEVTFNGQAQRLAITNGSNGFIVVVNPISLP